MAPSSRPARPNFPTDTIVFTATQLDKCVTVDDTNPPGPRTEVCVGDNPTEFEYRRRSGSGRTCTEHENTASIETNDTEATDEANKTVEDCQGADLTVTKTATGSFERNFAWTTGQERRQDVRRGRGRKRDVQLHGRGLA